MDKKHGYGVFKWSSGNLYKGNYKDDQRHGYGEMYWTDGSVYKGEWVKGIQHGYGEMTFPDGTKKVGIFDHNTFVSPAENSLDKINSRKSNKEMFLNVPQPKLKSVKKVSRDSNRNISLQVPHSSSLSKRNNSRRSSLKENKDIEDIKKPSYMNYKYEENNENNEDRYTPMKLRPPPRYLPEIRDRSTKTNYGSRK